MKSWNWILGFFGGLGLLAFVATATFVDKLEPGVAAGGALALALVLAWIVLDWRELRQSSQKLGTRYSANAALLVVVAGGIAVAANVLASRYDDRLDVSASQRFALSEQTLKVLVGLQEDVDIQAFFMSGSAEESAFKSQIEGYLPKSDHLKLEWHDPVREPMAAEQHHITSSYGTVVVSVGDSSQRLETDFGEEAITNAIIRASSGRKHPICTIAGHGELGVEDSQGVDGLGMAAAKLSGQNYAVRPINLVREGGVPADCELVLLADPQTDPLPAEREDLAAFVAQGGALLVLLDPTHAPKLSADMARYGIAVGQDIVVESNPKYQLVGGDPTYLVLDADSFAPHDITKDVVGMAIFRLARSVGPGPALPGITVSSLAHTTSSGWAETTLDGQTEPAPDDADIVGNVPLVALAEISDPTSIIIGARGLGQADVSPVAVDGELPDESVDTRSPAAGLPQRTQADAPLAAAEITRAPGGRVLVFGDSDFATNELLSQGNNQDLLLNAVAWLVGEDDQISIRPNAAGSGSLTMNLYQSLGVWLLCLLIVPGAAIGMAIGTWRKRRTL